MKKLFKTLLIILLLVFVTLLVLPFAFEGKLTQIAKEEINKQINAKADFSKLSLSFISSFPKAKISLYDLTVVGINEFDGDTLSYIENLSVKAGLMDVFKQPIEINSILLENVKVNALISEKGHVNWDIAKESNESDTSDNVGTEESSLGLRLNNFRIENARILYQDEEANMSTLIDGLDFFMSGDLSADKSVLQTQSNINALSFTMDGMKYLNKSKVDIEAQIDADLAHSKYTFNNNRIRLNDLELVFDGWVSMPNEDIDMDLSFQLKQNDFKHLLSLVPVIYMNDFQDIQTDGKVRFNGNLKGVYNENRIPGFNIHLLVNNARFQYPDLPSSVENILMNLHIENSDGVEDHTTLDLKEFHMEMANNPFDMHMKVSTPVSDPNIDGKIVGKIDLNTFKDLIPDDDMKIGGLIDANLEMKGKMSSIENEQYEDFHAKGTFNMSDFKYKDSDFPQGIEISRAYAILSPQNIILNELKGKTGSSDFNMKGKVNHILGWYFNEDLLKGIFEFSSNQIVLADFMGSENDEIEKPAEETDQDLSVIEIPANIDFVLLSQINKLIYDSLEMDQLKGNITLKDSKASLNNVSMNMLGGSMKMNGFYSSQNIEKPEIDFDLNAQNINIKESFLAFNTIQKLAPIAKYAQGSISASIKMDALLQQNMEVDLNTLNSKGRLTSDNIRINSSPLLDQLTSLIKSDKFKNLALEKMNLSYEMKNGLLEVKPFDTKVGKSKMTFGGSQSLDQSIDYHMDFEVPSAEFGSQANVVANNLLGEANKFGLDLKVPETIKFKTYVKGTLSHPKLSLSSKDQAADMTKELKDQAKQILKDEAQEVIEEAQKKADQLLAEADKQGKKIIAEAKELAEQVHAETYKQADAAKAEAYKQADNLVKEAGNDILKKTLAKKAAEKLKKEADNTAAKVKTEADKQKQQKIQLAKDKAQKLKDAAKKEGDALVKKAQK